MNYQLHREGQDLGSFPVEELHRRRMAGELTGAEYVWQEGMPEWLTLDAVLAASGIPITDSLPPPPLSGTKAKQSRLVLAIGAILALTLIAGAVVMFYGSGGIGKRASEVDDVVNRDAIPEGTPAERPVVSTTNAISYKQAQERARKFRVRQWIEGYKERGQRDSPCYPDSLHALETWMAQTYGGSTTTETNHASTLFDNLVGNADCKDPLVLTIAAIESVEQMEKEKRLDRALEGFNKSSHRAYPKFFAAVTQATTGRQDPQKIGGLFTLSLQYLRESFGDGSLLPEDQPEIADILITGWGYNFFYRVAPPITQIVGGFRKSHPWLALMVDGERHVTQAWRARGSGYADSVTEQGWEGFKTNLLVARQCFSNAWRMHPEWPLAAARMVYVTMSDSGAEEMRLWFDRAIAAQVDHPQAWNSMRFGLRPRWHGTIESMLALGKTAVETERFDTDAPRKFFDVVMDLESELKVKRGRHIYGRADIWPYLQRMYEGYIAEPSEASRVSGWRSTYAIVAFIAGKHDVAREQLEAVKWQPTPGSFSGWDTEVSIMALEVAARTGPLGTRIAVAEASRSRGALAEAVDSLKALAQEPSADERTLAFIRHRLAALQSETRLSDGGWVDFLPTDQNDQGWRIAEGRIRRLPDGALEVEAGRRGHMLSSRARMGPDFEIKGEFEVAGTSSRDFQAGLVIGIPEMANSAWLSYRMKRNPAEGDVVSFAQAWSQEQTNKQVTLNSDRNSFQFRLQNGRATASLNGKEVMRDAKPGRTDWSFGDEVYLGLGAYNDMNETVIRYRNIQVRQLPGRTAKGESQ